MSFLAGLFLGIIIGFLLAVYAMTIADWEKIK